MDMKVTLDRDAAASLNEKMLSTMAEDLARRKAGGGEPDEGKIAEVFSLLVPQSSGGESSGFLIRTRHFLTA